MPSINSIRTQFEGIRDERRTAANTAVRIGNAFLALLGIVEEWSTKFLSKVEADQAHGLITFLSGLLFAGDVKSQGARRGFTDGKGIWMDPLIGLIQTEGLEVTGFMRIMELVINRLQLMESDYSFTEGGEIEHVDYTDDGRLVLTMHKRHDNDYTPFYLGDILYAKVNDLLPRDATIPTGHIVTKNGSYFTVWMVVDAVDYTDNTLTVSLYHSLENSGDPIVPGGLNFTPYGTPINGTDPPLVALTTEMAIVVDGHTLGETGYDCSINVTRHGNVAGSADETIRNMQLERQQAWVLSTTDKRLSFFWRVDQPIIRDDNYALCLGILPDLANLPSTRDRSMPSLYINTIFYENAHHTYYPSRVVKEDRGAWVQNPTAIYTGIGGTYDNVEYVQGQTISEPYHFESFSRNMWLTYRLSPANASLTDERLLQKMRKEWHVDLETSRVWRYGALWECLVEGTTQAPEVGCTDWTLIQQPAIVLQITASKRLLRSRDFVPVGTVGTTLGFVLQFGGYDMTADIVRSEAVWTRQSVGADDDPALAAADAAWNQQHRYGDLSLAITRNDLPSNWTTAKEVQFTLTITRNSVPIGNRSILLH